jgi:hypothetical protein
MGGLLLFPPAFKKSYAFFKTGKKLPGFFSQPLKKAMSRVFFPAASFSRSKASLEKKLS